MLYFWYSARRIARTVSVVATPLLPSLSVCLPSRREEELRAELNFATCRVEELKRTLQETKSFLGPRLPTRGRDSAPMTAKGREGECVGLNCCCMDMQA
jgi:hypothetical protein